ncbi:MAG: tyrosine-type recombinase/integrase, partial [Bacteroidetes bacterium]|nr:tyrosine-type recombinase/integrase [Bacteroidota bacterium]
MQLYLEEQKHIERERIRQLEIASNQGTFEQLLDSYLSNLEMRKKRSISNIRHALNLYVRKPFPELLGKNSSEITSTHISLILRRMMDKGITTQSNRVRSMLHAAFQHGIAQDNDPRRYKEEGVLFGLLLNPVSSVPKQPDFERVGEHVISEDEIKLVWEALPNQTPVIESVLKLALITGQRPGEIIRLRWEDFNINEKTMLIPSNISKNSVAHIVPLAALGIRVIKELKKETGEFAYAFPGVQSGYYSNKTH